MRTFLCDIFVLNTYRECAWSVACLDYTHW
jgi:hypothetical protein